MRAMSLPGSLVIGNNIRATFSQYKVYARVGRLVITFVITKFSAQNRFFWYYE